MYANSLRCHNCYGRKGVCPFSLVWDHGGLVQFCSLFERVFLILFSTWACQVSRLWRNYTEHYVRGWEQEPPAGCVAVTSQRLPEAPAWQVASGSVTAIRFSGRAAALCARINDRELLAFSSGLRSHRSSSPGSWGHALLGSSGTWLPWAQHPAVPALQAGTSPCPKWGVLRDVLRSAGPWAALWRCQQPAACV